MLQSNSELTAAQKTQLEHLNRFTAELITDEQRKSSMLITLSLLKDKVLELHYDGTPSLSKHYQRGLEDINNLLLYFI